MGRPAAAAKIWMSLPAEPRPAFPPITGYVYWESPPAENSRQFLPLPLTVPTGLYSTHSGLTLFRAYMVSVTFFGLLTKAV
jgi:hypothetical protein